MKTILKEWKAFLNEEQITLNPADYQGDFSRYSADFESIVRSNRSFVKTFLRMLIKLEIEPLMQSLSKKDKEDFFNHVKFFGNVPNIPLIRSKIEPSIPNDSVIKNITDAYMLYDILKYYVSYRFGDQKAKDSLERTIQAEAPRHFKNIYWDLFKKYPNMVPVIPKLNVVDTSSDNLKYNFDIISKDFKKLTYSDVKDADILDQVTIIQKLGSGAFGKVYEIADNRALKIFSDGVDVKKDIERYDGVIDQVYKGEANLEDMHYFDFGRLGKSNFYYAIMPIIVPLEKVDFYNEQPIFRAVATGNKFAASKGVAGDYETFKKNVLESASLNYFSTKNKIPTTLSFQQALNQNMDKVEKIIQAGFRAYTEFGGIDLNQGNIGFIPQKPDTYFYFDM